MAIFTELAITVSGNKATFSSPVYFYLGDGDCTLAVTISKTNFKFGRWDFVNNVVEELNTAWASMCIIKPNGEQTRINKCEIDDGVLFITITKDMLDELEEIGTYKMQFHLYDTEGSDRNRITIPPVTFEVLRPMCDEGYYDENGFTPDPPPMPDTYKLMVKYNTNDEAEEHKFIFPFTHEKEVTKLSDGSYDVELYSAEYLKRFCCNKNTNSIDKLVITNNVINGVYMFTDCSLLEELDTSEWNTSNMNNIYYMFGNCYNLKTIYGISGWNTSKVTNMSHVFKNCRSLTSLNLNNWNTSNVTNMCNMFQGCTSLNNLSTTGWNLSNVKYTSYMFNGCRLLDFIDISGLNNENFEHCECMFEGCDSLETVRLINSTTDIIKKVAEELPDRRNKNSGTLEISNNVDMSSFIEILENKNWTATGKSISLQSIVLSSSSTEIEEGGTVTLSYVLNPTNTTQRIIKYEITGDATIDGNMLTCNHPGTVEITAYNPDSGIRSNTITIDIVETQPDIIPLESIVLNADKIEVEEGNTVQLSYVLNPSDTTQTNIEYIVDGDATLNGNILTCNSAGTVSVYVKSTDNPNIPPSNTITITVKEEETVIENYITIEYEGSIVRALFENYPHVNDFEVSYNGKDWNTFDNSLDGNYSVAYLRPTKTITAFSNMVYELSVDGTLNGDYSKLKCIDFSNFDASAITKINWFAHSSRTYAKIIMPLNLNSAIITDTTDPFGSNNRTTYIDARGLDTTLHTAVINSLYDRNSRTEGTYVANSNDLNSDLIALLQSKNWTLVQPN